jgi:hypothetical protein
LQNRPRIPTQGHVASYDWLRSCHTPVHMVRRTGSDPHKIPTTSHTCIQMRSPRTTRSTINVPDSKCRRGISCSNLDRPFKINAPDHPTQSGNATTQSVPHVTRSTVLANSPPPPPDLILATYPPPYGSGLIPFL